jgi:hypothetical protein
MSISTKDLARNEIGKLVNKWINSRGGDYTEQDTITNFILPFLRALGWDIYNVYEVKQRGYPVDFRKAVPPENRSLKNPDCITLINGKPHIVLEFKRLTDGGHIDRYPRRKENLLEKVQFVNAKYGVLTNFVETIIYDAEGKELAKFKSPKEYLERFDDLWRYLSK